jgi:ubiquinone/menaquinone biosynthesis C-methylase UbiE
MVAHIDSSTWAPDGPGDRGPPRNLRARASDQERVREIMNRQSTPGDTLLDRARHIASEAPQPPEPDDGTVWERVGRNIRSQLSLNRRREFAILCRMLDVQQSDSLLDVGSGDGFWTVRFGRRAAQVTGLEPDDALVGCARRLHERTNVRYEQGIGELLPFPDATFDKVVSVSSVEHFSDPIEGLREMFRVLRVGGRMAISVDALCAENSSTDFRQWHSARHQVTRYFREEELVSILTAIGFRVERATVHIFCSPLSRWARETFIKRPRLLLPLFPFFRGLVALGDAFPSRTHGQIIALCAVRPAVAGNGEAR